MAVRGMGGCFVGGEDIPRGGYAYYTSWGTNTGDKTDTSPTIERPDGYKMQFYYCATYGAPYGSNGSFDAQFQGSNNGTSWTTIVTGHAQSINNGGGDTSNLNNTYRYYRIVSHSVWNTRGMACMYLVKN